MNSPFPDRSNMTQVELGGDYECPCGRGDKPCPGSDGNPLCLPKKTVKECMHDNCRGAGLGYALCDDCGALLPDEDPDLYDKCGPVKA